MLFHRLIFFALACAALSAEGDLLRRVQAHLLLNDPGSAASETRQALLKGPRDSETLKAAVLSFAAAGDEEAMRSAFAELSRKDPAAAEDRFLIEQMAWGVLEKGSRTCEPITRAITLVAAGISDSAHGVQLLYGGMKDSSALIRAASIDLSKRMRDTLLQEEVVRLMSDDPSWHVRLSAMKNAGSMHARQATPYLERIVSADYVSAEERAAAVMSLAQLRDEPTDAELKKLVSSGREGLKLLALELMVNSGTEQQIPLIKPLLHDASKGVRMAALQVIGLMGGSSLGWHEPLLKDPQPEVALTAAWLSVLKGDPEGGRLLLQGLTHTNQEVRLYAAGLLKSSGRKGSGALKVGFQSAQDPFVRLNLALGLMGCRQNVDGACRNLADNLKSGGRWMWKQNGVVRVIAPSDVPYRPDIPQFPELMDQITRLEVIQVLAVAESPHAEGALKDFLQRRFTAVSGLAATVMFEEAEEEAEKLVRKLLQDSDETISAQAALLLALWGKEDEVVEHLTALYKTADRNLKERILEALGRIGSRRATPFLIERFAEPHQHLRLIAASSLIQCLNH
ncbi:MAG: HEAT repeat domain-containing protein [Chlamydiia bacterium]|nr:HEAT repeat domain-containing protein [Chlamydiia bacterium]